MASTLQGSLEAMPILELLQFLISSHRIGRLELVNGSHEAKVFLNGGGMTHALIDGTMKGEKAIFELIGWGQGTFVFHEGEHSEEKSITTNSVSLLMDGARTFDEWNLVRETIPSMEAVPRMSGASPQTADIHLSADDWRLIAKIDGLRTASDMAVNLGDEPLSVAHRLVKLIQAGLIEMRQAADKQTVKEETGPTLTEPEISQIKSELARYLGPVAEVVAEDISDEMGFSLDSFPVSRRSEFIEALAAEISQPAGQTSFKDRLT